MPPFTAAVSRNNAVKYTVFPPNDRVLYATELTGYIPDMTVIYTHNKTNGGTQLCGKKRDGYIVCNYDRGWDIEPTDENTQLVLELLLHSENW